MATQSTGGSAVDFGNAIRAQPDVYSTTEDALGVDGTHIILLDVTSNDSMSGGKTLYSVDDGRVSSRPIHDADADLLNKDTVYADATAGDLLAADRSTTDTSFLGAWIWITADGKIAYDASGPGIEALAQGQTATDSFVYAIRQGNLLYWSTVTLTVTGSNDAPVLLAPYAMPPIAANPISGLNTPDRAAAFLAFTDVDRIDTHTATISYVGAALSNSSFLPTGLDTALAAAAQVTVEGSTSNGTAAIEATFSAGSKTFDFLGQGQSLAVTYAVTLADNWGANSTQRVTFTVTGVNHSPVVSPFLTTAPSIVEASNTTGSTTLDASSATLTFTDVDLADTHTARISYYGSSFSAGPLLPLGLDSLLATAGQSTFTQDSTDGSVGAINFNFSAPDASFDFLGMGQILTVTYGVLVTDNLGAATLGYVAVTITGSDDAPVLGAEAGGLHTFTEGSPSTTGGTDVFSTTLSFSDRDLIDFHYASVLTPTFEWAGPGSPPTVPIDELNVLHRALDGGLRAYVFVNGAVDAEFSAQDSAFDFLAAGQTLTITYGVTVSDSAATSAVQPITVTVTGINDTPQIYGHGIPVNGHGTSIYAYFTDADLTDTHSVSLSYTGAQRFGGGALPSGLISAFMSDGTATVVQDATNGASGSVMVGFDATDPRFSFLALGEYLTVNYNLTIDDGHGGQIVDPLTLAAIGANDAPVVAADLPAGHSVSGEQPGVLGSGVLDTASATLSFSDVDLSDTHTVRVGAPIITVAGGSNAWGLYNGLLAADVLTLTESDSRGTGSGSVGITFAAADSNFDFLAAGEVLSVTYNITVTDNNGSSSVQPVTFTVTGTEDPPVLTADASGPHIITEYSGPSSAPQDLLNAVLHYTDPDVDDQRVVSAAVPTIVWSGGPTLPAGLATALSAANVLTFENGLIPPFQSFADVQVIFSVTDQTFNFLAAGDTLTITYTLTATDGQGLSSSQPLTIVVLGTNDAPLITSAPFSVSVAELAGHLGDATTIDTANAQIGFTDPDLGDTHAIKSLAIASVFGPHITPALQTALASAAHVSSFQDSTNLGPGQLNVTFGAPDSLFDFLSAGEQLSVAYNVIVTDNHGSSATRTLIFAVTGANDAPLLAADTSGPHTLSEEDRVSGSSDVHTAAATLTYTDPDLDDTHTVGFSTSLTWSGGPLIQLGQLAIPASNLLTVSVTAQDAFGTGSGSVQVSVSGFDSHFDFLAQGETLTLVDTFSISDSHGGISAARPLTVTVTGSNDAPVLAADPVAAHAVSGQPSGVMGQSTLDTGLATLRFTDIDFSDTHTVSFGAASATLSSGGGLPAGLQDLLNAAVLASVSDSTHINLSGAVNDSAHIGRGSGSINVSFSAADSAFDFLGPGQTLTVTYDVTVTDNQGAASTQAVTFTVAGANYDAVFAWSASGNLAATATADEFVFGSTVGADTISGFDPAHDAIDLIGFTGFASFADIQAHIADDASTDAVIALANGQSITLIGVTTAALTSANFLFDQAPALFNTGTLTVGDGDSHSLAGQVVNTGTIALVSSGDPTVLEILRNGATLTGRGQLILSDSGQNLIYGANPAATLINVDNTIIGEGQIGGGSLTLINEATIVANGTHALLIDTGSNAVINSGRIANTGTAALTINGALDNSGMLAAFGSLLHVVGPVTGSGVAIIGAGSTGPSTLEFGAASSEAVTFAGLNGVLKLDDPSEFTGRISNFSNLGHVDLVGIAPTATMHYLADADGFGGVLTVTDGIHSANIEFIGQNLSSHFRLVDDHLGGSLIGYF